jgi:hypothetical protein
MKYSSRNYSSSNSGVYSGTSSRSSSHSSSGSYNNKNISGFIPSSVSNVPSFMQTVKEGFALGIGSSIGNLITYNVLGPPKVNIEHTYVNDNKDILPCNIITKNCNEILLEYEKCKGDYNCNFDKLDKLKNDYENCKKLN